VIDTSAFDLGLAEALGVVPCGLWQRIYRDAYALPAVPIGEDPGCPDHRRGYCLPVHHFPPRYSTCIRAAWGLIEAVRERIGSEHFGLVLEEFEGSWGCTLFDHGRSSNEFDGKDAHTAPLAICLAASLALGVAVPQKEEV